MRTARTIGTVAVLVVATGGLAYVVDHPSSGSEILHPDPATVTSPATRASSPTARPHDQTPTTTPRPKATPPRTAGVQPETTRPKMRPGARILGPGDHGPQVRALQARLRQIAWMSGDVTDDYGPVTTEAVRGFQAKHEIPVTGYVDERVQARLEAMTHEPTEAELANEVTPMGNVPGRLDQRCRTGQVLCIDKTSRTLCWVVNGKVLRTVDVRFGASYSPTREGVFQVYWKDADHVSRLYGSAMPDSMFFSRGRRSTTPPTSPRAGTPGPPTAASTSATGPASTGCSPRSESATGGHLPVLSGP